MHAPLPPPYSDSQYFVIGHVIIHPSAAIAPGVILHASPGSHIVVAEEACIATGSVLHAYQGTIEICAQATLGTRSMVTGPCRIGERACLGAMATVFGGSIDADQVVAAGTWVGDAGPGWPAAEPEPEPKSEPVSASEQTTPAAAVKPPVIGLPKPLQPLQSLQPNQATEPTEPPVSSTDQTSNGPSPPQPPKHAQVYGRESVDRLMQAMFNRHRHTLPPT